MSLDDSKYERPCPIIVSVCDYSGNWSRPYVDQGYLVIRVDPKHGQTYSRGGLGYLPGDYGDGSLVKMADGGYGLALSAGALAARLRDEGGYFFDALLWDLYEPLGYDCCEVHGLLLAPPCTDFSSSGARWFKAKDADGRTAASVSIVRDCLEVRDLLAPDFWVLENPDGRLRRLVPELGPWRLRFHPWQFAGFADEPGTEAYTKGTCLWGDFNPDLKQDPRCPVVIEKVRADGSIVRGSPLWANLGGKSERTKELRSLTPVGFARAFARANP